MSWVVVVSEVRNPRLTERVAVSYVSPPHESLEDAQSLVVLLTGMLPTGDGRSWRGPRDSSVPIEPTRVQH